MKETTRSTEIRRALGTIREAERLLAHARLALEDVQKVGHRRHLSPIDARDEAMIRARDAVEELKPLEDMIGNLPGIDPWDPEA